MAGPCDYGRETREQVSEITGHMDKMEARLTSAIHRQDIEDAKSQARRDAWKTAALVLTILTALIAIVGWVRSDTSPAQASTSQAIHYYAPDISEPAD